MKIKTKKASRAPESSDRGTVDSSGREALEPSDRETVESPSPEVVAPGAPESAEPAVAAVEDGSLRPVGRRVSPGVRAQEKMLLGDLA